MDLCSQKKETPDPSNLTQQVLLKKLKVMQKYGVHPTNKQYYKKDFFHIEYTLSELQYCKKDFFHSNLFHTVLLNLER